MAEVEQSIICHLDIYHISSLGSNVVIKIYPGSTFGCELFRVQPIEWWACWKGLWTGMNSQDQYTTVLQFVRPGPNILVLVVMVCSYLKVITIIMIFFVIAPSCSSFLCFLISTVSIIVHKQSSKTASNKPQNSKKKKTAPTKVFFKMMYALRQSNPSDKICVHVVSCWFKQYLLDQPNT